MTYSVSDLHLYMTISGRIFYKNYELNRFIAAVVNHMRTVQDQSSQYSSLERK